MFRIGELVFSNLKRYTHFGAGVVLFIDHNSDYICTIGQTFKHGGDGYNTPAFEYAWWPTSLNKYE